MHQSRSDGSGAGGAPAIIDAVMLRRLALRTAVLWAFVHIAMLLVAGVGAAASGGAAIELGAGIEPAFNPVVVLAAASLLLLDIRALNEQRLLANLGIGARAIGAIGLAVACALELLLVSALAAF